MRKTFKRIVAAMLAAVTIGMPASASAGQYCSTGTMVKSNATGGDYIAGILVYETMGTVTRTSPTATLTTSTSVTGQVGAAGTSVSGTVVVGESTMSETFTVTTQEPIGFYAMNDGSVYQIDCATGEAQKVG